MFRRDDIGLLCSVSPAGNDIIAGMRNAILQAVIEVPMSRRQALAATRTMLAIYACHLRLPSTESTGSRFDRF
jgi:hypothetical protein